MIWCKQAETKFMQLLSDLLQHENSFVISPSGIAGKHMHILAACCSMTKIKIFGSTWYGLKPENKQTKITLKQQLP